MIWASRNSVKPDSIDTAAVLRAIPALLVLVICATFAVAVAGSSRAALASGFVQHNTTKRVAAADPLARPLINFFAGLDRTPTDRAPGRIMGHATALGGRAPGAPSWFFHMRRQVVRSLTTSAFEHGWEQPLAGAVPIVMDTAGGVAGPTTWHKLACGGRLKDPARLTAWRAGDDGRELLSLTLRCTSGRSARLILIADSTGVVRQAFGVVGMAVDVERASLMKGHKPLFELPSHHFLAQVQWSAPKAVSSWELPKVRPAGEAAAPPAKRGLWLFSPRGRPLMALFDARARPALRVGMTSDAAIRSVIVTIGQQLVDSTTLRWQIDASGRVTKLPPVAAPAPSRWSTP